MTIFGLGLNGCATKKNEFFFIYGKKFPWPLSRGGRAKGLSGRAIKKRTFFAASLNELWIYVYVEYAL